MAEQNKLSAICAGKDQLVHKDQCLDIFDDKPSTTPSKSGKQSITGITDHGCGDAMMDQGEHELMHLDPMSSLHSADKQICNEILNENAEMDPDVLEGIEDHKREDERGYLPSPGNPEDSILSKLPRTIRGGGGLTWSEIAGQSNPSSQRKPKKLAQPYIPHGITPMRKVFHRLQLVLPPDLAGLQVLWTPATGANCFFYALARVLFCHPTEDTVVSLRRQMKEFLTSLSNEELASFYPSHIFPVTQISGKFGPQCLVDVKALRKYILEKSFDTHFISEEDFAVISELFHVDIIVYVVLGKPRTWHYFTKTFALRNDLRTKNTQCLKLFNFEAHFSNIGSMLELAKMQVYTNSEEYQLLDEFSDDEFPQLSVSLAKDSQLPF